MPGAGIVSPFHVRTAISVTLSTFPQMCCYRPASVTCGRPSPPAPSIFGSCIDNHCRMSEWRQPAPDPVEKGTGCSTDRRLCAPGFQASTTPVEVAVADVDGHGLFHVERTVACVCDGDAVIVSFDAELWVWDARRADTWTFVSLPVEISEEIRDLVGTSPRGFGAVRVRATVGATTWTTSVFP